MADKFSLDNMMNKIQSLLARADHPNTPEAEADSARAMAEKLMRKYRIEESELIAKGGLDHETITPGSKVVDLCLYESEFFQDYWRMAVYIAQHTGCRIKAKFGYGDGRATLYATLVGYEADIRFAETLYTNARLIFADRMEPKPDPSLSDEDNVYRMRNAGMERGRIGYLMGWGGEGTQGPGKVTRVYKRACQQRGEEAVLSGRGFNVKDYRRMYAEGFTTELWNRMRKARDAAAEGGGAELVLANRKENVDEAFYSLFPEERPSDLPVKATGRKVKTRWTAADERAWNRRNSAAGQAGRFAGERAASEIDVGGNKPRKRLED